MTANLYPIPNSMYKEQRERLSKGLVPASVEAGKREVAMFLGGSEAPRYDTDVNHCPFRQESYFMYFFGYHEADCIACVEAGTGFSTLFIPRLPESYACWLGPLPTPEGVKAQTGMDHVAFVDEIAATLKERGVSTIHVMKGTNTDSGIGATAATFKGIEEFTVDDTKLYEIAGGQRVVKTAAELELMKYVNNISSRAHVKVMRTCKPGMLQHQLESTFLHEVYFHGGCRHVCYTCICATGVNNATLHYPNNDKGIVDGQMALLDMGGEYMCYCSDITCSFPVNGKFTENQKIVYNAVLDSWKAVMAEVKPGANWVELHKLATRVIARHLIKAGIITGTEEEVEEAQLMYTFMPHGLGHLMGLDVHDVSGFPKAGEPRPTELVPSRLRTARTLQENMVLTVEPGCYFNHALLANAEADPKLSKLVNWKLVREEFWNFGGVRLEDDVIVTKDGVFNMTTCPREIEDIEAVMAGKPWAPHNE